jgi:hypothetical protein
MTARPAIIALCALMAAHGASALAATSSTAPFPFCSWWTETTAETVNVAFPDTNAAYWTTPFTASSVAAIVLKGQYVDGRYFSVTAYNNKGGTYTCPDAAGVSHSSELTDFLIAPDPGSENPFVDPVPPTGSFTVLLKHPLAAGGPNTLPMPDATCDPPPDTTGLLPSDLGFFVLRSYLPDGRDFSKVPLPTVSLQLTSGRWCHCSSAGPALPTPRK